jgi:hypothetical protein
MDYIKVKDKDNLLRDVNSNGIVNTDVESYAIYADNYKRRLNSIKRVERLEDQVDEIKNDISEIKTLLLHLVNQTNH